MEIGLDELVLGLGQFYSYSITRARINKSATDWNVYFILRKPSFGFMWRKLESNSKVRILHAKFTSNTLTLSLAIFLRSSFESNFFSN